MNKIASSMLLLAVSCSMASCSILKGGKGKRKKEKAADSVAVVDSARLGDSLATATQPATDTAMVALPVAWAMKQLIDSLGPLCSQRMAYATFSGRAKVHFQGPDDNQEFTANFRIRKDSIIWVQISGLGGMVSVARICITPDSFLMINQLQREVVRRPLSHVAKFLPTAVDFVSLQNLVTGDPLRTGTVTFAADSGASWLFHVQDSAYLQEIAYSKTDSTMVSGSLHTLSPGGAWAAGIYGNYQVRDGRKLSTDRMWNIQNGPASYSLDMDFINSSFDQPLDFPFSVPKNYTLKTD